MLENPFQNNQQDLQSNCLSRFRMAVDRKFNDFEDYGALQRVFQAAASRYQERSRNREKTVSVKVKEIVDLLQDKSEAAYRPISNKIRALIENSDIFERQAMYTSLSSCDLNTVRVSFLSLLLVPSQSALWKGPEGSEGGKTATAGPRSFQVAVEALSLLSVDSFRRLLSIASAALDNNPEIQDEDLYCLGRCLGENINQLVDHFTGPGKVYTEGLIVSQSLKDLLYEDGDRAKKGDRNLLVLANFIAGELSELGKQTAYQVIDVYQSFHPGLDADADDFDTLVKVDVYLSNIEKTCQRILSPDTSSEEAIDLAHLLLLSHPFQFINLIATSRESPQINRVLETVVSWGRLEKETLFEAVRDSSQFFSSEGHQFFLEFFEKCFKKELEENALSFWGTLLGVYSEDSFPNNLSINLTLLAFSSSTVLSIPLCDPVLSRVFSRAYRRDPQGMRVVVKKYPAAVCKYIRETRESPEDNLNKIIDVINAIYDDCDLFLRKAYEKKLIGAEIEEPLVPMSRIFSYFDGLEDQDRREVLIGKFADFYSSTPSRSIANLLACAQRSPFALNVSESVLANIDLANLRYSLASIFDFYDRERLDCFHSQSASLETYGQGHIISFDILSNQGLCERLLDLTFSEDNDLSEKAAFLLNEALSDYQGSLEGLFFQQYLDQYFDLAG